MSAHEMVVLGQDRDGLIEAECIEAECGKHILVGPGRYIVLHPARDFTATHSFSTGLDIGITARVDPG